MRETGRKKGGRAKHPCKECGKEMGIHISFHCHNPNCEASDVCRVPGCTEKQHPHAFVCPEHYRENLKRFGMFREIS